MDLAEEVDVSTVVPVLNGETTLPELFERISVTLERCCERHEIVFVDDGSRDATWGLISSLADGDASVRGVRLARNSGHAAAVAAGFSVARGEIVTMIDADLETFPEDLELLVDAVRSGADLASGRRTARRVWFRELGSRVFNAHSRRSGIPLNDIGCGMNAMRHYVSREYVASGGHRRSLVKPLLFAFSHEVVEVEVRSVRPDGSHLGLGDLITFWLEFDVLHRRPPWAWFAGLGLAAVMSGIAQMMLGLLDVAVGPAVWWWLFGLNTVLLGALICGLGVLAGLVLKGLEAQTMPWFRIVDSVGGGGGRSATSSG